MLLAAQITVTKKLKENDVLDLKEKCLSTYGGTCNNDYNVCYLCLIKNDVSEITRKFQVNSQDASHVAYYKNLDFDFDG